MENTTTLPKRTLPPWLLALLPLLVTMAVAVFQVQWSNPLADKELPLLYLSVYVAIWLLGPGRVSVDARFLKK